MKNKIIPYLKAKKFIVLGAVVGAFGGYAYYYFVGCASGTCAITSSPINSTLYGIFMGGLLFDLIETAITKKTKNGKQ
jgi:H+/Cl- antiporter ClcA